MSHRALAAAKLPMEASDCVLLSGLDAEKQQELVLLERQSVRTDDLFAAMAELTYSRAQSRCAIEVGP